MIFAKEEGELEQARKVLKERIDDMFPAGRRVVVHAGGRFMTGTIALESQGECVMVRSQHGKLHRKHIHDVQGA